MQIEWTEKFSSGVEKLDAEHKRFIELINELQRLIIKGAGQEAIQKVIVKIYEHKKAHFAEEERLMVDLNYPEYEQHAKERQEMLDRLSQFVEGFSDGDKMVTVMLAGYLSDWLTDHIAIKDSEYGKSFNDRGVY